MTPKDYETLDEIFDVIDDAGVSVTKTKLERWRKWKLIPTPEIVGLGYAEGVEARYPVGTTERAIAIQRFLDEKRSRLHAGWSMWLAGYDVSAFVRGQIADYLGMVDHWTEPGRFALDGLTIRHVRRLVQGTYLSTFEKLVVDLVSGTYQDDWLNLKDDRDFIRNLRQSPEELKRFDKAVDKQGKGEDPLAFSSLLTVLSEGFGAPAIREAVERISDDDWRRTQAEAIAARKLAERFLGHPIDPVLTIGRLLPGWLAIRWGDSVMSQVLNIKQNAPRQLAEIVIVMYQELAR